MAHPKALRWNSKYHEERKFWLDQEPRQLLTSFAHLLPPQGRALDAACGVGTNALFLVEHGLRVFGLDISEYALHLAKKRAKSLNFDLETAVIDLSNPWLPAEYFDVILNFHFLERATFPVYRKALKSGGLIFFDTFSKRHDRNTNPAYYLEPGELIGRFSDFENIHYSEYDLPPNEKHKERSLAKLIARKP
jgi:SAM-dependent methyltransferase